MSSPIVARKADASESQITREGEHTQSIPKIPPTNAAIFVSPTFTCQFHPLRICYKREILPEAIPKLYGGTEKSSDCVTDRSDNQKI